MRPGASVEIEPPGLFLPIAFVDVAAAEPGAVVGHVAPAPLRGPWPPAARKLHFIHVQLFLIVLIDLVVGHCVFFQYTE